MGRRLSRESKLMETLRRARFQSEGRNTEENAAVSV